MALSFGTLTANLHTEILDFRGFDSNRIIILRRGILMTIGNFPESLSQRILAGLILEWRLDVPRRVLTPADRVELLRAQARSPFMYMQEAECRQERRSGGVDKNGAQAGKRGMQLEDPNAVVPAGVWRKRRQGKVPSSARTRMRACGAPHATHIERAPAPPPPPSDAHHSWHPATG